MAADGPQRENIFSWAVQWLADRKAIREAPPRRREVEVTYVLLARRDNGQPIGAFPPALYVMARATGVSEEEAFKTAIIPEHEISDEILFEKMITLSDEDKLVLPAPINMSHIEREFLSELHKTNLKISKKNEKKIKFNNNQTGTAERFLYYAMHWMATFLILFAIVELAATFALVIPSRMWLLFSLGYVVNIIVKLIGIFDLTESIMRNSWVLDKKYVWKGKWDLRKGLKTSFLLLIMSYFVFTATRGAWDAAMGASVWKIMKILEAPSIAITMLASFTAGSIALITAGLTWFGLERSIRSVLPVCLPFTFFNNTISFQAINRVVDELCLKDNDIRSFDLEETTLLGKNQNSPSLKKEKQKEEEQEEKKTQNQTGKSILSSS